MRKGYSQYGSANLTRDNYSTANIESEKLLG